MFPVFRAATFLFATFALTTQVLAATIPSGTKTITLISQDGVRQRLGQVTFKPDGDGATFAITFDAPELHEQFLSMRPFQCLSGSTEQWCRLTYDYGLRHRVTARDLMDLEYSLLFIWRNYNRVHADAWNGLYFKLGLEPDGSLSGSLYETDLNVLASPPTTEFARPVSHGGLTAAQPGRRQFERIEIK